MAVFGVFAAQRDYIQLDFFARAFFVFLKIVEQQPDRLIGKILFAISVNKSAFKVITENSGFHDVLSFSGLLVK
jgi:hypothetical protein